MKNITTTDICLSAACIAAIVVAVALGLALDRALDRIEELQHGRRSGLLPSREERDAAGRR